MTTSTKTKTKTIHAAATAKVADLEDQEQLHRANLDKATAQLRDLRTRNQTGDHTVTGLHLMTAQAEVEACEGLAAHAARMLAEARAEAAAILAEQTAQVVRERITLHDLAKAAQEAGEAVTGALTRLSEALVERDAASDAAGQELADAGVPPGKWLNGIRYVPVRSVASFGRVLPGRFNVEVQTEKGATAWLSSNGDERKTQILLTKMVHDVLAAASVNLPLSTKRIGPGGF